MATSDLHENLDPVERLILVNTDIADGVRDLYPAEETALNHHRAMAAVLAKIPKTSDGAYITPPMRVWFVCRIVGKEPEVLWLDVDWYTIGEQGHVSVHGATQHDDFDWRFADDCFSTRAAAEAAM